VSETNISRGIMKTTRVIDILTDPFERFFRTEASSGILLIVATVIALFWANSPWSGLYEKVIDYEFTLKLGELFKLSKSLLLWVNDGLMAIFFLVVGLEIKREILTGELSGIKQASMPVVAAIGGMVIPALFFIGLNHDKPGIEGWGIPMATDIAFSLGILSLLGKRVPLNLKIFLTAFAIVDDIGAVIIIALFYSAQIHWLMVLISAGLFLVLLIANFSGIHNINFYIITGLIIWYLFLKSGIHPTIAGVLLAFVIPANRKIRIPKFVNRLQENLDEFCQDGCEDGIFLTSKQLTAIDNIEYCTEKVQSPLQWLEHSLHGFVTFFVMPVFALVNAGIVFTGGYDLLGVDALSIDIAVSLMIGKFLGIFGFSYLFVKLGLIKLPANLKWVHIMGIALLGGVGFTMSIFISTLAFSDIIFLNHAKMGILMGSSLAGISGYILLRASLKEKITKEE